MFRNVQTAMTLPAAPTDMVEWSRKAANLLRAVGRAYVHGAPTEVQTRVDHLWKLASRGATLAGVLETQSKAFEQLAAASAGPLRAGIEQKVDLDRFDEAFKADLLSGREKIDAHVREALECEKDFTETAALLVEHLRHKPQCRDLF